MPLKTSRVYCSNRRDHTASFQSKYKRELVHGCTHKFTILCNLVAIATRLIWTGKIFHFCDFSNEVSLCLKLLSTFDHLMALVEAHSLSNCDQCIKVYRRMKKEAKKTGSPSGRNRSQEEK